MAEIGVIGAGVMGLTAALRFAQEGHQVTIIEREDRVGGLVASFEIGGKSLERFYHHLFRSDKEIQALIREVGLEHRLVWPQPITSSLWQGNFYKLDSATAVLKFEPLPFVDRLRLGLGIAYLKAEGNYHRLEGHTAADWIRTWMGPEVYRIVWGPLLRAKFGALAEQVALPWFWSRLHLRSQRLGYLRGGFYQLYERMATILEERGASIFLSTEVKSIQAADGKVTVDTSAGSLTFDQVLATTPTRLFMRLAEGLPEEYRSNYDRGDYYGAHAVILGLKHQLLDGTYWLSVHDEDFPFLACVEHTNYMPPSDYQGLHIVYLGNYLPMTDPLFQRTDEDILTEYYAALKRINPAFDESWVSESHVFKAPFAQPVVTVDYHEHIPPHETPLPGVYLANMFQVYPQDRGQNYSVKMANEVADRMMADLRTSGATNRPAIAASESPSV